MRRKSIRQPSIVVLGDINVDIMGRVKAWPQPGEDCLSQELEIRCGGVGANCAFGLARWGVAPQLVGCIGRGCFRRLRSQSAARMQRGRAPRATHQRRHDRNLLHQCDARRRAHIFRRSRRECAAATAIPQRCFPQRSSCGAYRGPQFSRSRPGTSRLATDQSDPRARRLGFARRRHGAEQSNSPENFANHPQRGYSARQSRRSRCTHRHARSFRSIRRIAQSRRARSGFEGRPARLHYQRKRQADAGSILLGARGGFHRSRETLSSPHFCKPDCAAGPRSKAPSPRTPPARWQPRSSAPDRICRDSAKSRRLLHAQRLPTGKWDEARKRVLARLRNSEAPGRSPYRRSSR